MPVADREFVAILPVKPPALGKSRLSAATGDDRQRLAEAFALDTIAAVSRTRGVRGVLVVTDDFRFAARARDLGCVTTPDATTGGLNEVLRQSAAEAVRRWPGATPLVICADLPALRSEDLVEVLTAMPDGAGFVRDARGTGTTVYASPLESFDSHFGRDSARLHCEAGAREVVVTASTVRLDVDEPEDLEAARALGVGAHTQAVLSDIG